MRIKRNSHWYIRSNDSHTNEVVANTLDGLNSVEKFSKVVCADGERRELCKCPNYNFIARLWRSKKDLKLDFEITLVFGSLRTKVISGLGL